MNTDNTTDADNPLDLPRSNFYRVTGAVGLLLFLGGLVLLRTDLEIITMGTVTHEDEYAVFSPVAGLLEEVNFREGDSVAKGDVVLSLDRGELELRLLIKRRELAELEYRLSANTLALKEFTVKPASVEVMVAQDKSRLLQEISEIQQDLVKRWEELERNRDVRTIELQQERIGQLRLSLEQLEAQVRAKWMEAGVQEIDREKLELELQRLTRGIALSREELAVLERERERLLVRAPIAGTLTRFDFRYPGLVVEKGQHLFTVSDPNSPYIVETLVPERNVDLIRPGTPARMESEVFNSVFEGYIYGKVISVAPDSKTRLQDATAPSMFEVEILVDDTPLPLVMGSSLKTYIVLGRRNLWELLIDRRSYDARLRPSSEDPS